MQTKNTKATWRKKDIDRIIKDRIIRDVWTLFKTNLSKKFLVSYDVTSLFTNDNYIVHESNGDRNRNLSLEEYLNKLNFPRVI